ncbi:alpha/beta fold hydrolase [Corynebacterium sp. 335C]
MKAPHVDDLLLEGPWRHRMAHSRGQRYHVAECGAPSSPLVLLLHGATGGWFDWRHQLEPLADAGFHAVAASLRGWGTSDRTPTGYRQDVAADDMAGLIRALGHGSAVVAGTGLGSFVAWTMSMRQPRMVRGLATVAGAHPLLWAPRSAKRRQPTAELWRLGRRACRRRTVAAALRRPGPGAETYADTLLAHAGAGYLDTDDGRLTRRLHVTSLATGALEPMLAHGRWLTGTVAARRTRWRDAMAEAAHVNSTVGGAPPVLMVHGADDRLLPPSLAQSTLDLTGRANCRGIMTVDGAGHFPQLEAPDAVTEALVRFAAAPGR